VDTWVAGSQARLELKKQAPYGRVKKLNAASFFIQDTTSIAKITIFTQTIFIMFIMYKPVMVSIAM